MSRRAYSEINLHVTYHTKGNLPLIKGDVEPKLYGFVKERILKTPGAYFHAVGGIEDHIHFAVSLPPEIQPAQWIGQMKGASSHHVNQGSMHKLLEWQGGYGVVSFGTKDLPWVIDYILNQKEHHKNGTTRDRLERSESDEEDDG
jgi:putative transposase